jgi:glycosyltransferase involved in cell wall biosynthesis
VLYVELNLDGTIGGSYFSLLYLVSGIDRARFEPRVIFASPNRLIPTFREAGVDARAFEPRQPWRATAPLRPFARLVNFTTAKWHSLASTLRYWRLLRRERIDLLHLNNSFDTGAEWMMAAWLAGVPTVTHQRGLVRDRGRMVRWLARRLSAVICISAAVRRDVESAGIGAARLVTIFNGLDPQALRVTRGEQEIRAELGIPATTRLIGMVGNIQRWKGQHVVLRALASLGAQHPDLACILIGAVSPNNPEDIAYQRELEAEIAALGLGRRVFLTGYRSDVPNYVNALEMLIHASVTPEPFGRVLLEGMAQHKPVIASRAGGAEEIIEHGISGLLYPPGDAPALAECIGGLLDDARRRREIGEAGYRRLLNVFGIRRNVTETELLYQSILGSAA